MTFITIRRTLLTLRKTLLLIIFSTLIPVTEFPQTKTIRHLPAIYPPHPKLPSSNFTLNTPKNKKKTAHRERTREKVSGALHVRTLAP